MLQALNFSSIGTLCRKIRMSRELEVKDITDHFPVSKPTISRIEQNNGAGRDSFLEYVQALKSSFAHPPLTSQQADNLVQLHDFSRPHKVGELEAELAALSLSDIKAAAGAHSNRQLRDLHELFRSQHRPALLCDDLWFDHALNGALLDLFTMSPEGDYMYDWKTWHSMAIKLHAHSPVVQEHDDFDHALPPTVQLFHAHSYRYLFTTQMQHLIQTLTDLSNENGMQFEHCWAQAITYAYTYSQKVLTNLPKKYTFTEDKQVYVDVQVQGIYPITLDGNFTVNYLLMTWSPIPGHEYSEQRFKTLRESGRCQKIYYAVDYDKHTTFHVNTWPSVQAELATRDF